jgi:hypothetical protein
MIEQHALPAVDKKEEMMLGAVGGKARWLKESTQIMG